MSRDGLLETGQFAVMSMIMINVHITTIYVQARFGSLNENCTNTNLLLSVCHACQWWQVPVPVSTVLVLL